MNMSKHVGTFEWNGHTISDPFRDETESRPVTPSHYGFEVTHTGGGCEAWVRDEEGPGVELWVTGLDGEWVSCGCWGWVIGLYYTGNDELEPIWCVTVPVPGEQRVGAHRSRTVEIADPDPRPQAEGVPLGDAQSSWKEMSLEQRSEFLQWLRGQGAYLGVPLDPVRSAEGEG